VEQSIFAHPTETSKAGAVAEFLCTDLDGTILVGDCFWDSLAALLGTHLWYVFLIPLWLLRGRAALKQEIARRVKLNVANLPARTEVVDFLRKEKSDGRQLILATGADMKIAKAVADHLGIFDFVLASDGVTNLTREKKLLAIQEIVGEKSFDYIGNGWDDVPVWKAARTALVVKPGARLLGKLRKTARVGEVFQGREESFASLWQSFRPQHWVKNLLVFVPIVMAHELRDSARLTQVLIAFASFSLTASGVYILNELLDVEDDRHHPEKKDRPFASGKVPLWVGFSLAPVLFAAGLVMAAESTSKSLLELIAVYVIATTIYSVYAKRVPILDVLFLAGLYLLRILGGGVSANVLVSPWLLAFSMFLLLSLAFTKRHAELIVQTNSNGEAASRESKRGYRLQDLDLVTQFGVSSGYLSVLVLALYVNGREVTALYRHPQAIWMACPLLLFWISRIWFLANRGKLTEDPVVFAARDPVSYILGLCLVLILLVAS
jgi:4-hydroxybenzoate polyprenyltransferase/phosphoserine phosphatase